MSAAERLLATLSGPFDVRGVQLSVSCSIGVAIARRGDSAESLVRDADTAMYRAKEQGRGRIVVFDDELRKRTVARLAVESDLGHALERGELELRYQPIVDPSTAQPVAAEALLRWRHPNRGVVQPLEFIHVAEDLGLIADIGAWVMEEADRPARALGRRRLDASSALRGGQRVVAPARVRRPTELGGASDLDRRGSTRPVSRSRSPSPWR